MKRNNCVGILCAVLLMLSVMSACSKQENQELDYLREKISVWDCHTTERLDTSDVSMDLFCSLSLPSKYKYIKCERMEYVNGYFYLLDIEHNKTVFVFDSIGNYVSCLGQRGRASSEYIDGPTNFCVNPRNNQVMVYERNAHRIHIYNQDGKQVDYHTLSMWPYDVGTLFHGKYAASFDYEAAGKGWQLSIFDKEENIVSPILALDEDHVFLHNERTFICTGEKMYHIPNFSDSVLVFTSDTLHKVVCLEFQSPFITQDIVDETNKGELAKFEKFEGITSISKYYETDRFITFSYIKSRLQSNCVIDKYTKKQYHFVSSLFQGLFPGRLYTIVGEDFFWLITEDDVLDIKYALQDESVQQELPKTHSLIRDIIQNRYKLPVILKARIKK